MNDWCSFCDFKDLDDDEQDCTCVEFCGDEECSGDVNADEEETTEPSGESE